MGVDARPTELVAHQGLGVLHHHGDPDREIVVAFVPGETSSDFIDLWTAGRLPIKSILLV